LRGWGEVGGCFKARHSDPLITVWEREVSKKSPDPDWGSRHLEKKRGFGRGA